MVRMTLLTFALFLVGCGEADFKITPISYELGSISEHPRYVTQVQLRDIAKGCYDENAFIGTHPSAEGIQLQVASNFMSRVEKYKQDSEELEVLKAAGKVPQKRVYATIRDKTGNIVARDMGYEWWTAPGFGVEYSLKAEHANSNLPR